MAHRRFRPERAKQRFRYNHWCPHGDWMNVVLISTYELGRQPFGLASPAAWLRARGHDVACLDLSREALDEAVIRDAELIAFYVPMHTATRLAAGLIAPIRETNPRAHI